MELSWFQFTNSWRGTYLWAPQEKPSWSFGRGGYPSTISEFSIAGHIRRKLVLTYNSHDPETVIDFAFEVEPLFRGHTQTHGHSNPSTSSVITYFGVENSIHTLPWVSSPRLSSCRSRCRIFPEIQEWNLAIDFLPKVVSSYLDLRQDDKSLCPRGYQLCRLWRSLSVSRSLQRMG